MDRRQFVLEGSLLAATWWVGRQAQAALPVSQSNSELLAALAARPLQKLAFGSCNKTHRSQAYWAYILRERPDLWVWLGDTIYADHVTIDERVALYQALWSHPAYQAFRSQVPIVGTWDDHDYAADNQDGSFPGKEDSKLALLSFLDVPPRTEVWSQPGVYQSYSFGPQGQRTQLILLDLRYNMERQRHSPRLLGEQQWAWLGERLQEASADLVIIGSSLNVSSPLHGFGFEGWVGFPDERKRLFELVDQLGKPVLFISGDRHFAEMSRIVLPSGRPAYELMSSGLTHAIGIKLPHPGRIGEFVGLKNYGVLTIEWDGIGPKIRMEIRSSEFGTCLGEHVVSFAASEHL